MRLFIANKLSPEILKTVAKVQGELRQLPASIKWVPTENIHLTLKFLGEVSPSKVEDIIGALEHAAEGISPYQLEIKGVGVFPNWRVPRVIWAGVDFDSTLNELSKQLDRELVKLGFQKNNKFRPHLTLGRLRSGIESGILKERLKMLMGVSWGKEIITSMNLIESCLTPKGAYYRTIAKVSFS
ncbi:MAG: 2,3-cyclic 3-phosphodiesterase [Clostridia bacterium]|nr:2,3-cyclic 3-phosphodiesterase [Clostridia bacterium]